MQGPAILAVLALAVTTACNTSAEASGLPDQVEGIPDAALQAYQEAAESIDDIAPDCSGMRWAILAGIGQEESHHGTLDGREVGADGMVDPPMIGPPLDGGQFAEIPDTDDGHYDNDAEWDRAVGPMQFLPQTWESVAPDATGQDTPDPQDYFAAARAAASYVCGQGETDLTDEDTLRERLLRYNQSQAYVDDVMGNIEEYDSIPTNLPAAGAEAVEEVGEIVSCEALDLHPGACPAHEHINETFGAFYLSAGGQRDEEGSDHNNGQAIDYMVAEEGDVASDPMKEQARIVINHAIQNHEELNIKGVIFEQCIWNQTNPVGDWLEVCRGMGDRGDHTQNHQDHIHLAAGPGEMR